MAEELFPILERILPAGSETLNFIDYTSRRSADNVELMQPLPADKVQSSLIFTFADDNVGILAQSVTQSIHELVTDCARMPTLSSAKVKIKLL